MEYSSNCTHIYKINFEWVFFPFSCNKSYRSSSIYLWNCQFNQNKIIDDWIFTKKLNAKFDSMSSSDFIEFLWKNRVFDLCEICSTNNICILNSFFHCPTHWCDCCCSFHYWLSKQFKFMSILLKFCLLNNCIRFLLTNNLIIANFNAHNCQTLKLLRCTYWLNECDIVYQIDATVECGIDCFHKTSTLWYAYKKIFLTHFLWTVTIIVYLEQTQNVYNFILNNFSHWIIWMYFVVIVVAVKIDD